MVNQSRIGKRIRRARDEAGMSQEELGRRMGLTGAAISDYERGKTSVTADNMVRLARVLGKPLLWLYGEEPGADPQLDLFMEAIRLMNLDERASIELAIRFVEERRKRGGSGGEGSGPGGAPQV